MQKRSEELTTKEASEYISKYLWSHTTSTLDTYRSRGIGPKSGRHGHRIYYLKTDLDIYIDSKLDRDFIPA